MKLSNDKVSIATYLTKTYINVSQTEPKAYMGASSSYVAMIGVKKVFLVLCCLSSLLVKAEAPSYVFHQLSIKDGLSEGTVRCIIEDKKGFMWFGTEDGLNKYDGYKFTVYKTDTKDKFAITSNNIKCLFNDQEGNLWVGTRHGINIYDHLLDRFHNQYAPEYTFLKQIRGDVESIQADKNGVIWVTTSDQGIFRIASYQQPAQQFAYTQSGDIHIFMDISIDSLNNLYIGTNDGLLYFDSHTFQFTDLRKKYGNGYQIRDLYIDRQQNLWLATVEGLKCISKTGELVEYDHNPYDKFSLNGKNVIRILPHGDNLLLAIDGCGIDYLEVATHTFYHYTKENGTQLNSNNTTAIYWDSKGTLWTGTFLNGVNFTNVSTNFFVAVKNNSSPSQSVQNGVVTSFLKDSKGNFWITTDGGGVFFKKKNTEHFINYQMTDKHPIIGSNATLCVTEDKEHNIWISTYAGGLTRLSPNGQSTIFRHNSKDKTSLGWDKTKAICEYGDDIWISTYMMGVTVFNKKTGLFRQYRRMENDPNTLHSDWVYWFFKDSRGTLWLGTFNGISKYIPEKDQFKTYTINTANKLVDKNYVFEITEDKDHNLWLGTNGGGLVLFDRDTEKFISYTTADGLSDNVVRTIAQDHLGDLWLGTNNGVSQFNIQTKKATPYTIHDGLPAGSFYFNSKFVDEKGKVYLGMNDGYLVIDPSLANERVEYPHVILTELLIFNIPIGPNMPNSPLKAQISETQEIRLPYDHNYISFEFAALNFNTPKHNYYAYKLEGLDDDWNYVGKNRLAKYTNLDPGHYTLKIKASNDKNLWSEASDDFVLVIAAPFWQTWWFKLSGAMIACGIIFGIFYLRTKNIRDRNKWLSEQVDAQTYELKEVNKMLALEKDQVLTQQGELLDKKAELEKSNEQLTEWSQFQNKLIGIIGHDIRGPLQNFSLLLQLQDEHSAEWVKEKLKLTADSLSLLATDLLSWVSLQSQRGEVAYEDFRWVDIIEKAKHQLASAWGAKNLRFVVNDHQKHPLKGVPPMVLACLRNIMSNSIRFSPDGSTIEIETGIEKDGFAGMRITDFGPGFDADNVNELIQGAAFTGMKDSNLKESAGLGLAICYDMIKRTGGYAEAASLPNSGASFFIFLPCQEFPSTDSHVT